ncbi:MAG: UvrD-helicase domain-containing protein [Synergistales bacterium]|nr:UvrD-helicase domain-containing protein [Synergistales bacterium]
MKFFLPPDTPKGQRDAITANDKLITVGAGAGTGKTWVLSGRYIRLLIEGKNLLPANILTLTYTEAAAEEMKSRIIERLEKELEHSDNPERKREILDGLADSWISTIHSFAGRLIRESGLSLDIDPTATVINNQQAQEFWEGIKNAVDFANLRELARTYGDKILRDTAKFLDEDEYMSAAVNKWRSERLCDLAREAAELHASSGRSWEEMLAWSEDDNLIKNTRPLIKNILADEWREVWEFFENVSLPEAKKPESSGAMLNDLLAWQKLNSPENIEALQHFYKRLVIDKDIKTTKGEPFDTLKIILGTTLAKWRDTRPAVLREISQNIDEEISEPELKMRKTLLKFCAVSWGMWDMMKKRRGLLSFADMILHARSAINNNSVKRNFPHILVDEFQDTDPLQFNMIEALAKTSEDTSLFAVGDPKQSIYKFRHADPSLFAATIKNADNKISLDVSFRTRKPLLTEINKIFASLWRGGLGKSPAMQGLNYENLQPAFNGGERDSGTVPPFEIILTRYISTVQEARKTLAEEIAQKISQWIKNGFTIWDKSEKIIRPVKFSDFAVLSRSRNVYQDIEAALEKFNIPSVRDRSEDFFTRGEIGDAVCMLRAAADINDSFAVAGWLMSPFSGVSEDEAINKCLTLLKKNNNLSEIIKTNLPEAYSKLEYLSIIGENEGPAGVLSIFNKDRKWLSCYKEKDRLRVLRNFRHALSMARSFQQSGTSSLAACADWLTRSVRRAVKLEEPEWHDEDENAVKLATVHSAKGLEYPVTIVFEGSKVKQTERDPLRPSRELGLVFTNIPDEIKINDDKPRCAGWENILAELGDLEEETRLFYVAATRAQDSLIFCGIVDEDEKPFENTWTKFLLDNIDDKVKINFAEGAEISYDEAKNSEEAEKKSLTPINIIHAKNSLRQFSASSFSLFEWCPFAWRRRYRQGRTLSWEVTDRDFEADENFTGGAALGSLAHWILARWPKNENFNEELEYYLNDREMISRLPAQLRDAWRDKISKNNLQEWLKKFSSSDLGIILRTEKNIERERRFMLRLDKNTALAGAMDAIYKNNVIDYKITSVDNAPSELYESQLDFYALAAHELTGHEVIKTHTAFLREGIFAERVCNNFDAIRKKILNAAEICASGPFNPKREHCAACPFKKGCAFFK